MKIRRGFVSNSSSMSFVISLKDVTDDQVNKILNHVSHASQMLESGELDSSFRPRGRGEFGGFFTPWSITCYEEYITGTSDLNNNFNMHDFFEKIGIDMDKVTFDIMG
ncbi:MAG: hypothetical protein ACOCW8_02480 [bacterium]